MAKITLREVKLFNLPLDNASKVMIHSCMSESILKDLETKYSTFTNHMFKKSKKGDLYIDMDTFVTEEDRSLWKMNYEIYIRSSKKYRFYIWLYKKGLIK